jgi:ABC-2 type transport system permease protein
MTALRAMILANLKMTMRNRTALFWLLAFPVIFIVLFGYIIGNASTSIDVGLAGIDTSPVAAQIAEQMKQTQGFKVTVSDQEAELAKLNDGKRDVVVVFGPGASEGQIIAGVYFNQKNPQISQIALAAVQQFLSQANAAMTDAPQLIAVDIKGVEAKNTRFIDFLIPGILAMSIMNNGMIGLASAFVSYRERGILRRIRATPFPLSSFIVARIVTQLLIAVVQSAVLLTIGKILFDLQIHGNIVSIVVMVALGSLAFLSIGFLISGLARNQEVADSMTNAIAFPMMFLGGVFFPIDSAPIWLKPFTRIIPLTYLANGLRGIMIDGRSLVSVWLPVLVMLVTASIALTLAVRFFRWEARTA